MPVQKHPPLSLSHSNPIADGTANAAGLIIPHVGVAKALYDSYINRKNTKKIEQFINAIYSDLCDLEKDIQKVRDLLDGDPAIPGLLTQFIDHARKAVTEEKLATLRSAATNIIRSGETAEYREFITEVIGEMSVTEVRILNFYDAIKIEYTAKISRPSKKS